MAPRRQFELIKNSYALNQVWMNAPKELFFFEIFCAFFHLIFSTCIIYEHAQMDGQTHTHTPTHMLILWLRLYHPRLEVCNEISCMLQLNYFEL